MTTALNNFFKSNKDDKVASICVNSEFEFENFQTRKITPTKEIKTPETNNVFNKVKFFEELIRENKQNDNPPIVRNIKKFSYNIKKQIKFFEFLSVDSLKNIFNTTYSKTKYKLDKFSNKVIYKVLTKVPENNLDLITYEKLANLINNLPDEQAKKLINYISVENFEKVISLISSDKLDRLFDKNADNITLDDIIAQSLKKLSNENISDEKLGDIITLVEEEKLLEHLNIISDKNLARIMEIASDDSLEKIISLASDENIKKILTTIEDETILEMSAVISDESFKKIINIISAERLANIKNIALDEERERIETIKDSYDSNNDSGFNSSFDSDQEDEPYYQNNSVDIELLGSNKKNGYASDNDSGFNSSFNSDYDSE